MTMYIFHSWIEASETGSTVTAAFGEWWDGDAGGGGGATFSGILGGGVGSGSYVIGA